MYILYSEYLTCMYIYLCKKVQNTVCFVATYRSCYRRMLMSLSGLVQLCVYWCSDLLYESLYSEPSAQPKNRKNAILYRNRTASYGWTERHCMSSMTRHPAATRQSLGTEHLWTARRQNDMRPVHTGLLQPNADSVRYWHTMTVAMTVTTSVCEWLNCDQDWRCHVFCPPDTWLEVCIF
jgi:hypothetical protein